MRVACRSLVVIVCVLSCLCQSAFNLPPTSHECLPLLLPLLLPLPPMSSSPMPLALVALLAKRRLL